MNTTLPPEEGNNSMAAATPGTSSALQKLVRGTLVTLGIAAGACLLHDPKDHYGVNIGMAPIPLKSPLFSGDNPNVPKDKKALASFGDCAY